MIVLMQYYKSCARHLSVKKLLSLLLSDDNIQNYWPRRKPFKIDHAFSINIEY